MADARDLPPLPIPPHGEVWRTYLELYRRDGRWADNFVRLYLRDTWSVPPLMAKEAQAARAAWVRSEGRESAA